MEFNNIGKYFMEEILHVHCQLPQAKSQSFLMERASQYVPTTTAVVRYRALCDKSMHPNVAAQAKDLFNEAFREEVKARLKNADCCAPTSAGVAAGSSGCPLASHNNNDGPPRKKSKTSENRTLENLDERLTLKDLTTAKEKITSLVSIKAKLTATTFRLTNAAKAFVCRSLQAPIECLTKHFEGDIDGFCQKYPNFTHTTFGKKCCCGEAVLDGTNQVD